MSIPTHDRRSGPRVTRRTNALRVVRSKPARGDVLPVTIKNHDLTIPPIPVPITWGGRTVDAPGFNQDRFERAMTRAFVDDLRLEPLGNGNFLVFHPGATRGQHVTRETCSCPAGQHDVPCKHRALVIAHLDIRMPDRIRRIAKRRAATQRQAEQRAAA